MTIHYMVCAAERNTQSAIVQEGGALCSAERTLTGIAVSAIRVSEHGCYTRRFQTVLRSGPGRNVVLELLECGCSIQFVENQSAGRVLV